MVREDLPSHKSRGFFTAEPVLDSALSERNVLETARASPSSQSEGHN